MNTQRSQFPFLVTKPTRHYEVKNQPLIDELTLEAESILDLEDRLREWHVVTSDRRYDE